MKVRNKKIFLGRILDNDKERKHKTEIMIIERPYEQASHEGRFVTPAMDVTTPPSPSTPSAAGFLPPRMPVVTDISSHNESSGMVIY